MHILSGPTHFSLSYGIAVADEEKPKRIQIHQYQASPTIKVIRDGTPKQEVLSNNILFDLMSAMLHKRKTEGSGGTRKTTSDQGTSLSSMAYFIEHNEECLAEAKNISRHDEAFGRRFRGQYLSEDKTLVVVFDVFAPGSAMTTSKDDEYHLEK